MACWAALTAEAQPVPLVILTGFLGAGKTTILNRVLGSQHRRRVAVLVNELGRIDIDAGLIRGRAGDVLELSGGCVCHAIGVQRELWSALEDVVRRSRPDIAILETTGLAEPDGILRGLEALAENAPDGKGPVRASAVVTVVDGEAGLAQLARHEEARDQVRAADRLLLSKLDRTGAERHLVELHRRLHDLNPAAERAAFAAGEAATPGLIAWLFEPARRSGRAAPGSPGHRHQLTAAAFVDDAPLAAEALLLVCQRLGDQLVRAKGYVHLAGEPRRGFLERAGNHTTLSLGAPWGDEPPLTRLVLIGEDLDEAALQRQLWACRVS